MKRSILLVAVMFFGLCSLWGQGEIYVSTTGNDAHEGSQMAPKASLHAALRTAREWRRLNDERAQNGIRILMEKGTYYLDETLLLRPEDAGTETSPTCVEALSDGVVLSGGMRVNGLWKKVSAVPGLPAQARSKVWVCEQPKRHGRYVEFRQLWVDGKKAVRARDTNDDNLKRLVAWDKQTGVLTIPAPQWKRFQTFDGMELVLHQMWAIANLRVQRIERDGQVAHVHFHQPESRIQREHPWPSPMTKEGLESPYFLCNAIEFLDSPGEWFLDTDQHLLYYWPLPDQELSRAEVIVPCLETLVDVQGNLDSRVSYVSFEGIGFAHTTWMRPSLQGHVPLQAGMYLLDAYKLRPHGVPGNPNKGLENQAWIGRPSAAVQLRGVHHTQFKSCRFEHMASCAIDYLYATHSDSILACDFYDIGGNAIQAGRFSDPGIESHLPYDPSDRREWCQALYIGQNFIEDCTNEDWGCVGICAGYVCDMVIEHNELCELSYSGISLGWGWQKALNCMRNNRVKGNYIHHYAKHMYDVAGIYTLSAQPKTTIVENVVDSIYSPVYVHDPNHWFYLYTDEGSSFMTVQDNWCPSEKFLQNANGPGNTWQNNGPMVSDDIRKAAGIQAPYQRLRPSKR